ncbi:MFS family permease [Variovorax boronicumulans]|uniref:MFS family permease n=1 Tax=Variovorax boronicumulans TaxID=436515 RepID=A0AAW8E3I2_9BURK|nr:MFS transporter [Variovorax boronicumulans]MDP9881424.1 MFS family permease [Variovorax boronicumulans]MDP9926711.1 MFS family permease [Variovorax boronicumulans]
MTAAVRSSSASARVPAAAFAVVLGGVSAALHLGKLPPAVPALQASLGIDLVEAGFLLSLVQVASMTLGLLAGLAADSIGLRRSMLVGLAVLTTASLLGGAVGAGLLGGSHAVLWLFMLRAAEGIGFLMAVMPGPGLIRAMTPAGADKAALGLWGAYMPLGVALALLIGPALIGWGGWADWWWTLSLVSAGAALWVWLAVPRDRPRVAGASPQPASSGWASRLRETVGARAPWLVALTFAVYSSQWMAVIGFLPAIYADAKVPAAWSAVLTALAAAMNIVGNLMGGRWLQRGVAPERLLQWGFLTMALGGVAAFAQVGQGAGAEALGLPPALRYAAICAFSLGGGMVPATLFLLGVRLAPGPSTVSTTVGLMQQASSLGQFLAPPAVAWLAHRVGGWHWTWTATLACSLAGMAVAARLGRIRRLTEAAA